MCRRISSPYVEVLAQDGPLLWDAVTKPGGALRQSHGLPWRPEYETHFVPLWKLGGLRGYDPASRRSVGNKALEGSRGVRGSQQRVEQGPEAYGGTWMRVGSVAAVRFEVFRTRLSHRPIS